jgi:hypothetical protein
MENKLRKEKFYFLNSYFVKDYEKFSNLNSILEKLNGSS